MDQAKLREYLLGRLSESERERVESLAFEDDGFEDRLCEAEYDLLDDWARGALPAEAGKIVERRFAGGKLAAARMLARKLPRGGHGAERMPPGVWRWIGIAAALGLAAGLLPFLYLLKKAEGPAPVAGGGAKVLVAELALHVPVTRGSGVPVIGIPAGADLVRISVDAEAGYGMYEVRIEARARGLVFLQAAPGREGVVRVTAPAWILSDGAYEVSVSGQRNGETTLLAAYACRIQRDYSRY